MSEFKRERRYVVIKLSKLTQEEKDLLQARDDEIGLEEYVFPECVVVEADWPNYEETWATVQDVAEGTYIPRSQLEEQNAALAAQAEALKQSVISARARGSLLHNITMQILQGAELNGSDWDYISESQVVEIEHHLRELRAEAGRAGFMYAFYYKFDRMDDVEVSIAADQYAEQIRQGGAK